MNSLTGHLTLLSPLAPTCAIFANQTHFIGKEGEGSRTHTSWHLFAFLCGEGF